VCVDCAEAVSPGATGKRTAEKDRHAEEALDYALNGGGAQVVSLFLTCCLLFALF